MYTTNEKVPELINFINTNSPDKYDYPVTELDNSLDTKYLYVCHSELNAILNSIQNLKGCTLYVSLFPTPKPIILLLERFISLIFLK